MFFNSKSIILQQSVPQKKTVNTGYYAKTLERLESFMKVTISSTKWMATYHMPLHPLLQTSSPAISGHSESSNSMVIPVLQKMYSAWQVLLWKGLVNASECLRYRNLCLVLHQHTLQNCATCAGEQYEMQMQDRSVKSSQNYAHMTLRRKVRPQSWSRCCRKEKNLLPESVPKLSSNL